MSTTTEKKYRFTSAIGRFNAGKLKELHDAKAEITDELLASIAKQGMQRFGKDVAQVSTESGALARLKRDLARIKRSKWAVIEAEVRVPSDTARHGKHSSASGQAKRGPEE